jgi:hypothetical protein
MSLFPSPQSIERMDRAAAANAPRLMPIAPVRRTLLFLVLFLFVHTFSLFVAAQVARLNPGLLADHPGVVSLLCGEGTSLATDFRTRREGGSRSLDGWIVCHDRDGGVIEGAGRIAAWLSALPLSIPLGMLLFRWVFHASRKPRREPDRSYGRPRPVTWRDRLLASTVALVLACALGLFGAAATAQMQREAIDASPLMGRLLCGEDLRVRGVDSYSRQRRLGCFDASGREVNGPNNGAFLKLAFLHALPIGILLLALASMFTTVQRVPGGSRYSRRLGQSGGTLTQYIKRRS